MTLYMPLFAEIERLKRQLVAEMILTRTRAEMIEDFGPEYEYYLAADETDSLGEQG